jgi:hypothetical protein
MDRPSLLREPRGAHRPLRGLRGPATLVFICFTVAVVLSTLFTNWAINHHSQETCPEIHALATARGAQGPWEKAVSRSYQKTWRIRCE